MECVPLINTHVTINQTSAIGMSYAAKCPCAKTRGMRSNDKEEKIAA